MGVKKALLLLQFLYKTRFDTFVITLEVLIISKFKDLLTGNNYITIFYIQIGEGRVPWGEKSEM